MCLSCSPPTMERGAAATYWGADSYRMLPSLPSLQSPLWSCACDQRGREDTRGPSPSMVPESSGPALCPQQPLWGKEREEGILTFRTTSTLPACLLKGPWFPCTLPTPGLLGVCAKLSSTPGKAGCSRSRVVLPGKQQICGSVWPKTHMGQVPDPCSCQEGMLPSQPRCKRDPLFPSPALGAGTPTSQPPSNFLQETRAARSRLGAGSPTDSPAEPRPWKPRRMARRSHLLWSWASGSGQQDPRAVQTAEVGAGRSWCGARLGAEMLCVRGLD